jgi:P4 family phage/plasmid primase-like protien
VASGLVTPEMMETVIMAFGPAPEAGPRRSGGNKGDGFRITWTDVQPYLGDRITKEKPGRDGATIFEIRGCPYDQNDHADDTTGSITVFADGGMAPSCRHDHCQGKGFIEFLAAYAPHLLDSVGNNRKKKRKLKETVARIAQFAKPDVDDPDEDGERCRIEGDQLRKIATTITGANDWRAPIVANLITELAYHNHFARDEGEKFYVYDRGAYRPKGEERVRRLTKLVVPHENWSSRLASETVEYLRVDSPYLWKCPRMDVLNLENGLLDIKTRELMPHSPDHLSTVQLPVRYEPSATCPAWEMQVASTFPEDAVHAGVAWEIVAWLMLPHASIQKALLLLGPGGTGKSTFLAALFNILGAQRNVSALSLQKIESDRFAPARLVGKLANICADLPSTHLETSSIFKSITGGDPIVAEYKFKDSFDFAPFARLIFSANQPPQSRDATEAFFQRWYVLPFTNVFRGTPKEINRPQLDATLVAPEELSGVLNKALAALPRVLNRGLTITESMRRAHEEFWKTTDPLSIWLTQNTVDDANDRVAMSTLINSYNAVARQDGRAPANSTAFGLALKRLRPHVRDGQRTVNGKEKTWCYIGIGLRAPDGGKG